MCLEHQPTVRTHCGLMGWRRATVSHLLLASPRYIPLAIRLCNYYFHFELIHDQQTPCSVPSIQLCSMLTYDVCSVFKFIHEEVFNSRMDEPVPFISQTAAWKIY